MGSRAACWIVVAGLLTLGGLAHAEDRLPGVVADGLYRAEALLVEKRGDAAAAASALEMLAPLQTQAISSVRFWTTYHKAWKAAGRDEATFWSTVVGPLQTANPKSPTFDLVRAGLAKDPKEKRKHVDSAIAKNPAGIPARLMLARLHLAADNLDEADALLDELLDDAPEDRGVLLAKGDIYIKDGMGKSAVRVADQGLEAWGEDASFYNLKARAAQILARRDAKQLAVARAAAAKAVELDPSTGHVGTFVDVLKALGEGNEARRVLDEQFRRTGSAVLGAMLGREAFEQGDYVTAIRSMEPALDEKIEFAKAHAVSLARTAQTAKAREAIAKVRARDPKWEAQARRLLFLAGDAQGALDGAPKGEVEDRVRVARILGWLGDSGRVLSLAGDTLKDSNRKSEDVFLYLLMARVLEGMGADKAQALRSEIIKLRGKIGKRARPLDPKPSYYKGGKATHEGYAIRAVSYFLTPDGYPYQPVGEVSHTMSWTLGNMKVFTSTGYWQVRGRSSVDKDVKAQFRFNEGKSSSSGVIELRPPGAPDDDDEPKDEDEEKDGDKDKDDEEKDGDKDKDDDEEKKDDEEKDDGDAKPKPKKEKKKSKTFSDAVGHLDAAIRAVIEGNYAKAVEDLDKTLVIEPHWARAAVFRAAARALGGQEPERAMAGREARRIHEAYPDDLEARELAVFLDHWAGVDAEEDIREIEKRRATRNQRDIKKL